jgi:hypothetical protein
MDQREYNLQWSYFYSGETKNDQTFFDITPHMHARINHDAQSREGTCTSCLVQAKYKLSDQSYMC